jgi:predicted MPP superfamily phosphohydrolase
MNQEIGRIFLFLLGTMILQLGTDILVLRRWHKFVLKQGWNKRFFSQSLWLAAAIIFILSIYAVWHRFTFGVLSQDTKIIQWISALWYLPKLPVFIWLVLMSTGRFILNIFSSFRAKTKKDDQSVLAAKAVAKNPESLPPIANAARRDFISKAGWTLAGAPFVITANGIMRTAYDFQTEKVIVPMAKLPAALDGLTIVQISDIHSGSFFDSKPIEEVRRIIESLRPDIITITGDYVNFKAEELSITLRELSRLKAPLGVYGSLGNHDHYMQPGDTAKMVKALESGGITMLVNSNVPLDLDGWILQLAGTDNTGLRQNFARIDQALENCVPEYPTILLAHDPSYWDIDILAKKDIDLMLSGHTHGGQVGIMIPGMEISLAQVMYKRWAGLYTEGNQHLYVNRGIGTVGPPIRIGVPPEITHFTLKQQVKTA